MPNWMSLNHSKTSKTGEIITLVCSETDCIQLILMIKGFEYYLFTISQSIINNAD